MHLEAVIVQGSNPTGIHWRFLSSCYFIEIFLHTNKQTMSSQSVFYSSASCLKLVFIFFLKNQSLLVNSRIILPYKVVIEKGRQRPTRPLSPNLPKSDNCLHLRSGCVWRWEEGEGSHTSAMTWPHQVYRSLLLKTLTHTYSNHEKFLCFRFFFIFMFICAINQKFFYHHWS